jgi:protein TonB
MFEQTFVTEPDHTKRPWTIAASAALQTAAIATVLLIPLFRLETIQPKFDIEPLLYLTKLAPPPPPVESHALAAPTRHAERIFTAPTRVPRTIDMTPDPAPEISTGFALPMTGLTGILSERSIVPMQQLPPAAAPKVEVKPQPAPAGPQHVGGDVQAAKLVFGPKPAYPQLARIARVQGIVKMQAIIARDGSIRDLHASSGPALLIPAALDAVRQWRYQPTSLNGVAVEVETEIDVIFALN